MQDPIKSSQFSILSYPKKLKRWDRLKLDFMNTSHLLSDETQISILPINKEQNIAYAEWVINHHRKRLIEGKGKLLNSGFRKINYLSFQELTKRYHSKVRSLDTADKFMFKQSELNKISAFISNLKPDKAIYNQVETAFKAGNEKYIYECLYAKKTSAILELRRIAKLWDALKYKVFLDSLNYNVKEKNVLYKQSHCKKIPPSFNTFTGVTSKDLPESHLKMLFHDFVKHSFFDGDFKAFKALSEMKELREDDRLIWLDIAPKEKGINKHTLFKLLDCLFQVESRRGYRQLVHKYFVYPENGHLKDFALGAVSKSLSEYQLKKAKETTDRIKRERQISSIFNPCKSIR